MPDPIVLEALQPDIRLCLAVYREDGCVDAVVRGASQEPKRGEAMNPRAPPLEKMFLLHLG